MGLREGGGWDALLNRWDEADNDGGVRVIHTRPVRFLELIQAVQAFFLCMIVFVTPRDSHSFANFIDTPNIYTSIQYTGRGEGED